MLGWFEKLEEGHYGCTGASEGGREGQEREASTGLLKTV